MSPEGLISKLARHPVARIERAEEIYWAWFMFPDERPGAFQVVAQPDNRMIVVGVIERK
jgi:hypothetical protein